MKLIWLLIVILIALLVVAIKFLPWWASLLVLLTCLLGVRLGLPTLLRRAIIYPFQQKGKILAQAVVQVHNLQPAPLPQPPPPQPRDWYYLYLTIIPTNSRTNAAAWFPHQLLLLPPEVPIEDMTANVDQAACLIQHLQLWQDQDFRELNGQKVMGPQRLKFYIGLLPGVRQLKFRYYYEEFGDILIPSVGVGLPGPIQAPLQVPAQPPAPDPIKQPLSPPEQEAQDSLVGSELAVSPALLALAQAGDLAAIATLLNQGLQPRGVRAKIRMRGNTLKVLLEAPMLPKQSRFAPMVYRGVIKLKIQSVYQLQVHGRHIGEKEPAWSETFFLRPD